MRHFKKTDLLNSVSFIKRYLNNLNLFNITEFDNILKYLNFTGKELHKKATGDLISSLFIVWYESGICKEIDDEVNLLINIDKLIDILKVDRIEFYSYIVKMESALIPKHKLTENSF